MFRIEGGAIERHKTAQRCKPTVTKWGMTMFVNEIPRKALRLPGSIHKEPSLAESGLTSKPTQE